MDDPPGQLFLSAEKVDHIPMSIPDVKNHRHIHFNGQLHLLCHHLFLHIPGRKVVVIIQPDFPQRHALFILQHLPQFIQIPLCGILGLMGMHTAGSKHPFMAFCQFQTPAG